MFVLMPNASREEAFAMGAAIAARITELNPKPVKLRFEKVRHLFYWPISYDSRDAFYYRYIIRAFSSPRSAMLASSTSRPLTASRPLKPKELRRSVATAARRSPKSSKRRSASSLRPKTSLKSRPICSDSGQRSSAIASLCKTLSLPRKSASAPTRASHSVLAA